jgi:hypothetical protein
VIGQCAASLYAINSHVDASLVGLVVGWLVLLVGWLVLLVLLVGLVGWSCWLVGGSSYQQTSLAMYSSSSSSLSTR